MLFCSYVIVFIQIFVEYYNSNIKFASFFAELLLVLSSEKEVLDKGRILY